MNKIQEDKLSMYLAVKSACTRHQAVWSTLPAFATQYATFLAALDAIESAAGVQGAATTGARTDKANRRQAMSALAVQVGGAVEAYARIQGDNALAARVSVTPSDFTSARDTEAAQIADRILAEAQAAGAAVADYGVTADVITRLTAAIAAYRVHLSAPRDAIVARQGAGADLQAAFTTADTVLTNVLDLLIPVLRTQSAAFAVDYENARIIVNSATRSREEEEGEGEAQVEGGDGTPIE